MHACPGVHSGPGLVTAAAFGLVPAWNPGPGRLTSCGQVLGRTWPNNQTRRHPAGPEGTHEIATGMGCVWDWYVVACRCKCNGLYEGRRDQPIVISIYKMKTKVHLAMKQMSVTRSVTASTARGSVRPRLAALLHVALVAMKQDCRREVPRDACTRNGSGRCE